MARNYTFAPGEYYHIYARGFEKLPVFRNKDDYNRFLESLYLFNSKNPQALREVSRGLTLGRSIFDAKRGDPVTDICAYCLMPNHFHLLLREIDEKGISKFMQKLMTAYTMYFNQKYERKGAIFGSSFKGRHVIDDRHLKYLFSYTHLNPREIIKTKLEEYPYSSYPDYLGIKRAQVNILNKKAFPDYFEGNMRKEIEEWLSFGKDYTSQG